MTAYIEMTAFRLSADADRTAFMGNWPVVTDWARRQPGFQRHEIVDRGEEGFVDLTWWDSEGDAETASNRFMADLGDTAFTRAIDPATVEITRHPVTVGAAA